MDEERAVLANPMAGNQLDDRAAVHYSPSPQLVKLASYSFMDLFPELRHEVYKHMVQDIQENKRYSRPLSRPLRYRLCRLKNITKLLPYWSLMLTCHRLFDEISKAIPKIIVLMIEGEHHLGETDPDRVMCWHPDRFNACFSPPLHHVHRILQKTEFVTGYWERPWGSGIGKPTIPVEALYWSSLKHWRRVEMVVDMHVDDKEEGATPSVTLDSRLKDALDRISISYQNIHDFIRCGRNRSLRVTVLFKILGKASGRKMCVVSMEGSVPTMVERNHCALKDNAIISIFSEVFTQQNAQ